MKRGAILLLTWLVALGTARAIDADKPIEDPQQRALYERLTNEVRCLVCQNQTIADSNAALAMDLRQEIREKVEAGQSEAQIKSFLTERYGDFVLYRPRFGGVTLLLWLAPVALVALGLVWLLRILKRRADLPVTTEEQDARDA